MTLADVLVLPGVGNFGYLAAQLKVSKLKERILSHYVGASYRLKFV